MRKINCLMKQKKRSMVLLPPALVQQAILDFFQCWWVFFMFLTHQYRCGNHHDPLLLHMDTLPPWYYSSYSHTSGSNMSFPSLGEIFSSIHVLSPSDQLSSLSSSNTIYLINPSCNTGWNSNTNTPSSSNTSNTPAPSTSTHQPYSGYLCADCIKKYLG